MASGKCGACGGELQAGELYVGGTTEHAWVAQTLRCDSCGLVLPVKTDNEAQNRRNIARATVVQGILSPEDAASLERIPCRFCSVPLGEPSQECDLHRAFRERREEVTT